MLTLPGAVAASRSPGLPTGPAAIRTEDLTLRYGSRAAVDGLTLTVERGAIYGFLGPNGAGKTSTISMLLGLRRPTAGRVLLFGEPLHLGATHLRRRVGVVGERQPVYDTMTVSEYLSFFAELYAVSEPRRRIRDLTASLDLADRLDTLAVHLSHGMRQKLGFARALLHDPELLILDEPQSGLDPHGIRQVRDLILAASAEGKTVFISSHILSEIERTAHRVGILHRGRLLAEDTMANLRRRLDHDQRLALEVDGDPAYWARALRQLPFVRDIRVEDATLIVSVASDTDHRAALSRWIQAQGGVVLGLRPLEVSLEEAFLTITDQNLSLLAEGV